jgi:hypothetical protein
MTLKGTAKRNTRKTKGTWAEKEKRASWIYEE